MSENDANLPSGTVHLNEFQARRIRVTCEYIDKLLGEIETTLAASAAKAAFPRFVDDVAPAQRRTAEDYIRRIRAQLLRVLAGQGIPSGTPSIPVSRAVHAALGAIDISAEELKPDYMKGYGALSDEAAAELNGIAGELHGLVTRLDRYIAEGAGHDLKARLDRLEHSANNLRFLAKIEQVVTACGLVEFRPPIAAILDRAEDKSFEIAVFGRVSSGKSSLLNAILETEVLPVGVTPVTAVPVRVVFGEEPQLQIAFANAPVKRAAVSSLPEYATEQHNPGNAKRVSRIVVQLPAARLRGGVAFVDTPGLGSLATSGAAETLAYLPKCDLGVVLLDADSGLTAEDLPLLRALDEAAIPVDLLLSKADLLAEGDCEKVVEYVKRHLLQEIGTEFIVHAVSVVPSHRNLLARWFDERIQPLYDRSQELRGASLRRKIGVLGESVISALRARLRRSRSTRSKDPALIRKVEARLRLATGSVEESLSLCDREIANWAARPDEICRETAALLLAARSGNRQAKTLTHQEILPVVSQCVQGRARQIQARLETLCAQLYDALLQSARDLAIAEVPDEVEFHSLVREMPLFDPGTTPLRIRWPALAAGLGARFALSRMAKRIQAQLGESFFQGLFAYFEILRQWAGRITSQLGLKYEMYAERYRADAASALGSHELTSPEFEAAEANLKLLEELSGSVTQEFKGADSGASSEGGT